MPKATVVEESEYYFEEGWYDAQLVSVAERTIEFTLKPHHAAVKNGKGRVGETSSFENWRWTFDVKGGPRPGFDTIDVDTDPKVTTRADDRVRIIYAALRDEDLEVGAGIDTDLLEGLSCQVYIRHDEPSPKKDGTLGYYCRATDFAPSGTHEVGAGGASYDEEPPF